MVVVRVIRNRYGSATAALEAWLEGSLWGNPIGLGHEHWHVYGANKRTWQRVCVDFLPDKILVMKYRKEPQE